MRRSIALLTLFAAMTVPAAAAGPNGTYRGKATNMDRDFRYGKVLVKVRNNKVTYLKVEAVTTSGCGGFMDVVFAPADPETQIIGGSQRIRDGRFTIKYRPVRDIEDQDTFITARFRAGKVTGRFQSMSLCSNEGRFVAKR